MPPLEAGADDSVLRGMVVSLGGRHGYFDGDKRHICLPVAEDKAGPFRSPRQPLIRVLCHWRMVDVAPLHQISPVRRESGGAFECASPASFVTDRCWAIHHHA